MQCCEALNVNLYLMSCEVIKTVKLDELKMVDFLCCYENIHLISVTSFGSLRLMGTVHLHQARLCNSRLSLSKNVKL